LPNSLSTIMESEPASQPDQKKESRPDPSSWKPKRLAIITRRFWPVSGASELAVGRLAAAIHEAGHTVEIFTINWQKTWPTNLHFGEIPVRRLPKATSGPWRSLRTIRPLSRHLVDFQPDGILAFGYDEQTWLAAKAFSDRVPFVVRMDSCLIDPEPSRSSNMARQTQVLDVATSLLVDCQKTAEELKRLNPDCGSKIQIVPDLTHAAQPEQRTPARKNAARNALSDAHPVLSIETDQPLVVCAAPLGSDVGVLDLVRAWPAVLERHPRARLWIIGDGYSAKTIWEEINELGLVYSVIMPGFFDDLSEVLLTADVYVHPLRHAGYDNRLIEALLSGICCVASPATEQEGLIKNSETGVIADPGQTAIFSDALIDTLCQSSLRQRLGHAGHRANAPKFEPQQVLGRYLKPFSTLE
jgi:glycosyltransferase involved in cell wall biosynthesis